MCPQGGGSYQLRQACGGNTEIAAGDTMELAKYTGATPEDIVNGLEGAGVQPKDKVVQSVIENMKHEFIDGPKSRQLDL